MWDGRLDELAIFNHALTAEQILNLYRLPGAIESRGLHKEDAKQNSLSGKGGTLVSSGLDCGLIEQFAADAEIEVCVNLCNPRVESWILGGLPLKMFSGGQFESDSRGPAKKSAAPRSYLFLAIASCGLSQITHSIRGSRTPGVRR